MIILLMKLVNLSNKPLKLNISKKGLENLIILPDYSPLDGLPAGSIADYNKEHKLSINLIGKDIGCGMLFGKLKEPLDDFKKLDDLYSNLKQMNFPKMGGGNHFLSLYEVKESNISNLTKGDHTVLIHAGNSYNREIKNNKDFYDFLFNRAKENRFKLCELVSEALGMEIDKIFDKPHNTIELIDKKTIYRKGAVKLKDGEYSIIPSYVGGELVVIKANENISKLKNSISHGTGRAFSRSESKHIFFDFKKLKERVYIPDKIKKESLNSEHPLAYNKLDKILDQLNEYISIEAKLINVAYLGGI